MGRHTLIALAWMTAGLALALVITWGAAWAYPLGGDVIWAVGGVALLAVVAINLGAVREGRARDRGATRRDD